MRVSRIILIFWFGVCQICRNWISVKFLELNFRIFCPSFSTSKIILVPSVFEKSATYRVFTYCFVVPQRAPVREIRYIYNGVKYVEALPPGTLWAIASDSYRWVHPDGFITTLPYSSPLHFRTTLQNSEGDIAVTFYPSVNCSALLVGVGCRCIGFHVIQTQSTTLDGIWSTQSAYFRQQKLSCEWHKSRFHPNVVGAIQLVHCQFPKVIFSKLQ